MNHTRFITSGAAVAAIAIAAMLSGCSSVGTSDHSGAHGSRVELYSSEASLADASASVVVGTVTSQKSVADITPETDFTISSVEVVTAVKADRDLSASSTIQIRQLGSGAQEGPAPLLVTGETYLLYLTPSGLDGELSTQYYVTGGTAGLYQAVTDVAGRGAERAASTSFAQVESTEGENLPADLTLEDVTN